MFKPMHQASLALALLALAGTPAFAQTTYFVDDDAPTDPGPNNPNFSNPSEDGSDTFPFDRINEAIDAAANGDTIIVRPGTYFDTSVLSPDGKAITLESSGGASVTFIEGFAVGPSTMNITNSEGRDTIIDGFTFQGGQDTVGLNGGAMDIRGTSSPTVRNCVFINNTTTNDAGAIFISGSPADQCSPLFENVRFENNTSSFTGGGIDGGAVFSNFASPVFLNCEFVGNSAFQGSAIGAFSNPSLNIIGCTFTNNDTGADGAIHIESSQNVVIRGCTFTRNEANGGGAIDLDNSTTLIDRCVFHGNFVRTSGSVGGAILTNNDDLTVTNSVFVGNTTPNDGGAVGFRGSTTALFENCTITANEAGDAIGGILTPSTSRSTLINCIVAGNLDFRPTDTPDYGGTLTAAAYSASYSVLDTSGLPVGADLGSGLIIAMPVDLFVRVPDAGADMVWGTPDDDYGDLRLLPTAMAIDAGSSLDYMGPLADLDANDRAQDDPNTVDTGISFQSPIIDLGAFEFTVVMVGGNDCVGDFDLDGDVDLGDFGVFGSEFGRTDCNP